MTTETQTITIDGVPYDLAALSDGARAQLTSWQFTDQEIARVQQTLAVLQTARNAYAQALQAELPSLEDQAFGTLTN